MMKIKSLKLRRFWIHIKLVLRCGRGVIISFVAVIGKRAGCRGVETLLIELRHWHLVCRCGCRLGLISDSALAGSVVKLDRERVVGHGGSARLKRTRQPSLSRGPRARTTSARTRGGAARRGWGWGWDSRSRAARRQSGRGQIARGGRSTGARRRSTRRTGGRGREGCVEQLPELRLQRAHLQQQRRRATPRKQVEHTYAVQSVAHWRVVGVHCTQVGPHQTFRQLQLRSRPQRCCSLRRLPFIKESNIRILICLGINLQNEQSVLNRDKCSN